MIGSLCSSTADCAVFFGFALPMMIAVWAMVIFGLFNLIRALREFIDECRNF